MSSGEEEAPAERDHVARSRVGQGSIWAALLLAVVGAFIVVPRPTFPEALPLPPVDNEELTKLSQSMRARALGVRNGSLSKEVRAVGEQVRRIGLATAQRRPAPQGIISSLRTDIDSLLHKKEVEPLLDLQALQTELFLSEVKKLKETGKPSIELLELGGAFGATAATSWFDESGELLLNQQELRTLYRAHWIRVTGLSKHPAFRLSQAELRRYYATQLLHPATPSSDELTRQLVRLSVVDALGRVDSEYPALLARGIIELQLNQPVKAERSLRAHLAQHPNGPWARIAENHLMLAVRSLESALP